MAAITICSDFQFSSVQFSRSVVSDSLRPHESQHARAPCPSPAPRVHSDSLPLSQWCHPAISSSVISFSPCPQPLPASESFPMSQLFAWGGQSTGVSALEKSQSWSPSECAGVQLQWIQGDSKVGMASASLEKYIFNYRYIERLETDSVVGDKCRKRGWITWSTWNSIHAPDGNSARKTRSKKEMTWGYQSFQKLIRFLYSWVCLYTFCYI